MTHPWLRGLLLRVRELRSRLKVHAAERRLHERRVELAIERIVDQVNPRLRGLGGYRRRLFAVAEGLIAYADELAARIPGPLTVDPDCWSSDPLVNALFGNVQRIRQVVSGPAVRAWLRDRPASDDGELHALLAVMPEERTRLGTELVGDRLQRDVQQRTLSFSDHELFAVAETMPEVRQKLSAQIVDLIVSFAIAEIAAQEERIAALEQAVTMLRLKLKVVDPRIAAGDLLAAGSGQHRAERDRLQARIDESERDLADARQGLADIDEYLSRLEGLLTHPERRIGLERMHLWLDRMNVVRDRSAPGAHEIDLVRARRPDQPGRVAQYIRFPRRLILSVDERLADVERYLGM